MEPRRNMTSASFEAMSQRNTEGFLPVLIDIKHPGIVWDYPESTDPEVLKFRQKDGHLRLVNDTRGVLYKGDSPEVNFYEPCVFSLKLGKEDGKTKSNANIKVSSVDVRMIELIRSIDEDLTCKIVAMFTKIGTDQVKYAFTKLYGRDFEMSSVSWTPSSAQWEINPDSIMDLAVPRDMMSKFRLPSINEDTSNG